MLEGHCLCGAVTMKVGKHEAAVSVCHCSLCQRWTGFALAIFHASHADVQVTGPVKTYRSSPFAERAWCERCGTHLWIRDDGADYEFTPALFEAARNFPLERESYVDRAYASARFAGDHRRRTAAEYEANHPFVPGRG